MKHPLVIQFEQAAAHLDPERLAALVAVLEHAIETHQAEEQLRQLRRDKSQIWRVISDKPAGDPLFEAYKKVYAELTDLYDECDILWEESKHDLEYLCKAANIRYFASLHNVTRVIARIWAATDETLGEGDFVVTADRAGVLHVRRRDPEETRARGGFVLPPGAAEGLEQISRAAASAGSFSEFASMFTTHTIRLRDVGDAAVSISFENPHAIQAAIQQDNADAIARAFGVPDSMLERPGRADGGPVRPANYIVGEGGLEFQAVVMRAGQVDSSGTVFSHEALMRLQQGMQERIESILWNGVRESGGIAEGFQGRSPLASLRDTLDKIKRAYDHAQAEVGADLAARGVRLGEDRAQPPRNLSKLTPIQILGGTAFADKRGNILFIRYDRG